MSPLRFVLTYSVKGHLTFIPLIGVCWWGSSLFGIDLLYTLCANLFITAWYTYLISKDVRYVKRVVIPTLQRCEVDYFSVIKTYWGARGIHTAKAVNEGGLAVFCLFFAIDKNSALGSVVVGLKSGPDTAITLKPIYLKLISPPLRTKLSKLVDSHFNKNISVIWGRG